MNKLKYMFIVSPNTIIARTTYLFDAFQHDLNDYHLVQINQQETNCVQEQNRKRERVHEKVL